MSAKGVEGDTGVPGVGSDLHGVSVPRRLRVLEPLACLALAAHGLAVQAVASERAVPAMAAAALVLVVLGVAGPSGLARSVDRCRAAGRHHHARLRPDGHPCGGQRLHPPVVLRRGRRVPARPPTADRPVGRRRRARRLPLARPAGRCGRTSPGRPVAGCRPRPHRGLRAHGRHRLSRCRRRPGQCARPSSNVRRRHPGRARVLGPRPAVPLAQHRVGRAVRPALGRTPRAAG